MALTSPARLVAAGGAATLVGIGLGRFAYAALLPEIVAKGWFTEAQGAWLGAANLLGYLIGALLAPRLSFRLGPAMLIRGSVIAVTLSFALCAVPLPFAWFLFWRLLAGIAGATLMVVAPSAVMARLPEEARRSAGSVVFCGIGAGVLISATLVPALVAWSLTASWLALATAAALLTALGWVEWARAGAGAGAEARPAHLPTRAPVRPGWRGLPGQNRSVVALVLAAYALDAVGFVPHTVFWVDFLVRQPSYDLTAAGAFWALFGAGALIGPFAAGQAARRLGWHRALVGGYLVKTIGVGLPLVSTGVAAAALSSLLVGAMVPGIVALTSGRLAELTGAAEHRGVWGLATAAFAGAQAVAAYGYAALAIGAGGYAPLFAVASAALLAGTLVVWLSPRLAGLAAARS